MACLRREDSPIAIMTSVTLRKVDINVFDEINRVLGAVDHPPSGLIVHFAYALSADAVRIIDVWQSEDAHDAYDTVHDPPGALARLHAERGLGSPLFVSREVVEIRALIRGVSS
jgi:hypothetical protein